MVTTEDPPWLTKPPYIDLFYHPEVIADRIEKKKHDILIPIR